jgi:hypothetical protein
MSNEKGIPHLKLMVYIRSLSWFRMNKTMSVVYYCNLLSKKCSGKDIEDIFLIKDILMLMFFLIQ